MLKVTERPTKAALEQVNSLADQILAAMAEAGAEQLRDNLAAGSRSGIQYPGQPRRSSAPGEYPQQQRGVLRSMVKSAQTGLLKHYFGLVPQGRAETLQALSLELGAPRNNLVARAPVRRTALAAETHRRLIAAARRA